MQMWTDHTLSARGVARQRVYMLCACVYNKSALLITVASYTSLCTHTYTHTPARTHTQKTDIVQRVKNNICVRTLDSDEHVDYEIYGTNILLRLYDEGEGRGTRAIDNDGIMLVAMMKRLWNALVGGDDGGRRWQSRWLNDRSFIYTMLFIAVRERGRLWWYGPQDSVYKNKKEEEEERVAEENALFKQ